MLCVKAFIIPASLQFVSVFNIMFISCIWLLHIPMIPATDSEGSRPGVGAKRRWA
jgi:hypothetical protein